MPDAPHQLFRTYEERAFIVGACCISVTFRQVEGAIMQSIKYAIGT
jgi:hypothetical protein